MCFRGVDLGVTVDFFLDLSDLDGLLLALLLNLQGVSLFQAVVWSGGIRVGDLVHLALRQVHTNMKWLLNEALAWG